MAKKKNKTKGKDKGEDYRLSAVVLTRTTDGTIVLSFSIRGGNYRLIVREPGEYCVEVRTQDALGEACWVDLLQSEHLEDAFEFDELVGLAINDLARRALSAGRP